MAADPENDIARRLTPQAREHYDALRALTDDELRAHLKAAPPSGAAALTLYLLDRVVGYRKALDLVAPGPSRGKTDTSAAAAEKVSVSVGSARATILVAIASRGEGTREQVGKWTGIKDNTVRPRMREMLTSGYLELSGEEGVTDGGNAAELVRLTDDGWRMIRQLQQAGHEGALRLRPVEAPRSFADD